MVTHRSHEEAARDLRDTLQSSLNCLKSTKVLLSPPNDTHEWAASCQPIRVGSRSFEFAHYFKTEQVGRRQFRARTVGYLYQYLENDQESIAWHWHPLSTVRFPHIHSPGQDHIPSGRVLLEEAVYYTILERGWPPAIAHWQSRLYATAKDFAGDYTWLRHPDDVLGT